MKYTLMALGVAAAVSAFLYGAFGVEWWTPIHSSEPARVMAMVFGHLFFFGGGLVATVEHFRSKS
jgi:uncharacterized membrane protein